MLVFISNNELNPSSKIQIIFLKR